MQLYIAYKNYSSWSLRPWIALKVAGIPFEEILLPFAHNSALKDLAATYQLPARVPVLKDGDQVIWDSLAILEYLAESFSDRQLWPEDKGLRALARCAAAEMHSGFPALRSAFPMNCRVQKQAKASPEVTAELHRLAIIWEQFASIDKPSGPFLCGHFSIVDAMFAPVMWRVRGYGLTVSPAFAHWSQALYELPDMQQWLASAEQEEWVIESYERAGEQQ
ncbi:MAG: glutathione S-transferase family protein [Natronospirillum sp.]